MFHVTQFSTLAQDSRSNPIPIGLETMTPEERLNEPGVSEPFEKSTKFVRLWSDCQCYFEVGAEPEASVEKSRPMSPGEQVIGVTSGQRVSVIWE